MLARILRVALALAVLYILLFLGLTDAGLLGPDEPRYASIGREMAFTGDFVTPRLWGKNWFEKPALLYWMTGLAFRAGLSADLAPRLPVALASLLFLIFFQRQAERRFGRRAAWFATGILATTAGWFAFSQLCVPDLPMSAAYGASMMLCLGWIRDEDDSGVIGAGLLLGVAILAKGLVPVVLALPLVWFGRRRPATLAGMFGLAAVTAAPWYVLCALENGLPFLREFFWEHHFGRFATEELQHVQPVWFYVPVLLAGFVPWTPLLACSMGRQMLKDPRLRFLIATSAFGFVFFSASTNKLPGYLLPLFPLLAVLAGVSLARRRRAAGVLFCCGLLLAVIPVAAAVLPDALQDGLSRADPPPFSWLLALPVMALSALIWWLDARGKRDIAFATLVAGVAAGVLYFKATALPALDERVSARPLAREVEAQKYPVCAEEIHRAWRYGLNYYTIEPLPPCTAEHRGWRVRQPAGEPPRLVFE